MPYDLKSALILTLLEKGKVFFKHEKESVVQPPEQKSNIGTVPDSGTCKDNELIDTGSGFSLPVASKRNIEVFSEPAGEGDMPSPPEFPYRDRGIGILEVFFKVKAEHPAQADCHITVPAEVKVDLKHISDCAQPGI